MNPFAAIYFLAVAAGVVWSILDPAPDGTARASRRTRGKPQPRPEPNASTDRETPAVSALAVIALAHQLESRAQRVGAPFGVEPITLEEVVATMRQALSRGFASTVGTREGLRRARHSYAPVCDVLVDPADPQRVAIRIDNLERGPGRSPLRLDRIEPDTVASAAREYLRLARGIVTESEWVDAGAAGTLCALWPVLEGVREPCPECGSEREIIHGHIACLGCGGMFFPPPPRAWD